MRRICIVGIRGIGKTTLIKSILPKLPWIDYLVGSNILRQLVGEDFVHFDQYPDDRKQYFREQAIKYMEQRQLEMQFDILVDGHTTLYNSDTGLVEGVFTELDCNFYTDLIHYDAPAKVVLTRRKNDKAKKRIVDLGIIKNELAGEREESLRIAKTYGMGWYQIKEDEPEKMQDSLHKILLQLHNNTI
jgi:adenylate kinase